MTDPAKLKYSDGIAAARTLIALKGNADALQRRLPDGWELAPYAGDDLRGRSLRDANLLVPLHEVFAVRTSGASPPDVQQVGYVVFISQARHRSKRSNERQRRDRYRGQGQRRTSGRVRRNRTSRRGGHSATVRASRIRAMNESRNRRRFIRARLRARREPTRPRQRRLRRLVRRVHQPVRGVRT